MHLKIRKHLRKKSKSVYES